MSAEPPASRGRNWALGALVFFGGFAVMVLEIVGARFLQPFFGGSFYIWTSQIGVVMLALAMGYAVGGRLADRWQTARPLGFMLIPAGIFILLIPHVAGGALDMIVDRYASVSTTGEKVAPKLPETAPASDLISELPADFLSGTNTVEANAITDLAPREAWMEVPPFWQKMAPALGSAIVFLLPCFVLAMISPYIIRLAAQQVEHVGTLSGTVYAASTVGSIAGVFVTAYILLDHFSNSALFRFTGWLTFGLAGLCFALDRLWPQTDTNEPEESDSSSC